jgi:hypothetical protein
MALTSGGDDVKHVSGSVSAALLVFCAGLFAVPAAAAEGDQTIRVQNGEIRCLLSSDYQGRGWPAAVCGRADGGPFQVSPSPLNLAVVQGEGEMYFIPGTVPGDGSGDVVVGPGQTYTANGWTVKPEELRTLVWNDYSRHGMRVNPVEAAAIWV